LECPDDEVLETAKLVMDKMGAAYPLKVPLKTDAQAGINWGSLEKLEI
jgi:DNA polymerase I-like protein with 3'-5' exonuclease and polymerase domains